MRPSRTSRPRRLPLLALSAAAALVATACSGEDPRPAAAGSPSRSATPSSAPATPTPSPADDASATSTASSSPSSPAEPSATATPTATATTAATATATPTGTATGAPADPAVPAGRYGRLLTADRLPGFGGGWREAASLPREDQPLSTCQRFGMSDIGAQSVVVRTFDPLQPGADGDVAATSVATFPDTRTADRAAATLRAWEQECGYDVNGASATTSDWRGLDVADGAAAWYRLDLRTADSPEDDRSELVALARRGVRIAQVRYTRLGRPGRAGEARVAEQAARRAWELLAGS